MKFSATALTGAYIIDIDRIEDERGSFARTFCRDEFAARGLHHIFVQCNLSSNARRGTLRGMHFQAQPHEEAKLVSCTRGAIYDVILDLRRDSATFGRWVAFEITAENGRLLYIPEGFAHGFQSLEDNSDVFYMISETYRPELARGVRWNDPTFDIDWPLAEPILSRRDAAYLDFR